MPRLRIESAKIESYLRRWYVSWSRSACVRFMLLPLNMGSRLATFTSVCSAPFSLCAAKSNTNSLSTSLGAAEIRLAVARLLMMIGPTRPAFVPLTSCTWSW